MRRLLSETPSIILEYSYFSSGSNFSDGNPYDLALSHSIYDTNKWMFFFLND